MLVSNFSKLPSRPCKAHIGLVHVLVNTGFLKTGFLMMGLLLAAFTSQAADQRVLDHAQVIADSRYHHVPVKDLNRGFHLLVRLPVNYPEKMKESYPVVYLLDGGMLFPMLSAYYRYLRLEELVPDMIVVGISYGASSFPEGNYRSHDYTAPSKERDHYGGAERFQQVLSEQILPLIEQNYRADPKKRYLFGQSLGGQLVIYSAMTRPELFAGHIASNPALHGNLDYFLEPRREVGQLSKLLVLSAESDEERFLTPRLKWIERWEGGNELPVTLDVRYLDGYGHFSIVTESFRQGLIWASAPTR